MILIHYSPNDYNIYLVFDWLLHLKEDHVKISFQDKLPDLQVDVAISNEESSLIIGSDSFTYTSNFKYWNRRNELYIKITEANKSYSRYINKEMWSLSEFVSIFLETNTKINRKQDNLINKLNVLNVAKEVGLQIPNTIITSNKSVVLTFIQQHKTIISKAIDNSFYSDVDYTFTHKTQIITQNEIETMEAHFHPMLFQNYIQKLFEIRCFFLNGDIYSSAIFSQNDPLTTIDFRNYNMVKPNRIIPHQLPIIVKDKITLLMNLLNLQSASIDLIYSDNKEYVFLEANPVGNFDFCSTPCNYKIEKKLAIELLK